MASLSALSHCGLVLLMSGVVSTGEPGQRVQLRLDPSEAEAILQILAQRDAGHVPQEADWARLFGLEPYKRLKLRESDIARRAGDPAIAFTDDDFKAFVLSTKLAGRASALRVALERWQAADLNGAARDVLPYLPPEATIRAKVFVMIKPRENSFVWELKSDPTIFLYLNPETSAQKFTNTVAHELHHIGLGSLGPVYEKRIESWPERPRVAAEWIGAFGEGLAMLAAAGSPDVDPHAASNAEERARWGADLGNFDRDLPLVNGFFEAVLNGQAGDAAAIERRGSEFFGRQGPWYTVGYRMAVVVEKRFGREALVGTMLNPPCLLGLYNRVAAEHNAEVGGGVWPLWSQRVLSAVDADGCMAHDVPLPAQQ